MSNALALITSDIYGTREAFDAVLADKSINFDAEAGFAIQVISASEYALSVALGNRQAVVNAVTNIAAIGLSLNPARKQAYLVPRKAGKGGAQICLDISYMGLMDLAIGSGSVQWAHCELVYANDAFELQGYDKPPVHHYNPFSRDRGELIGVYIVVKTHGGDYLTETMDIASVYAIRDRSEAWKSFAADKIKSCPWSTDEGEMVKKTIVKRAYKYWPKTPRLDAAIHHLNTDGGEGVDMTPHQAEHQSEDWLAKVNACKSVDELRKVSKAGAQHFNKQRDREGYEAHAKAVQARGAVLRAEEAKQVTDVDDEFVRDMTRAEGAAHA